jgi:hypothetical protein
MLRTVNRCVDHVRKRDAVPIGRTNVGANRPSAAKRG